MSQQLKAQCDNLIQIIELLWPPITDDLAVEICYAIITFDCSHVDKNKCAVCINPLMDIFGYRTKDHTIIKNILENQLIRIKYVDDHNSAIGLTELPGDTPLYVVNPLKNDICDTSLPVMFCPLIEFQLLILTAQTAVGRRIESKLIIDYIARQKRG